PSRPTGASAFAGGSSRGVWSDPATRASSPSTKRAVHPRPARDDAARGLKSHAATERRRPCRGRGRLGAYDDPPTRTASVPHVRDAHQDAARGPSFRPRPPGEDAPAKAQGLRKRAELPVEPGEDAPATAEGLREQAEVPVEPGEDAPATAEGLREQ